MRYVSSLVQIMLKISRELEDGEKRWVIAWSMKSEGGGIGPVNPACMVLVKTRVLAMAKPNVLFIVHTKNSAFTM